MVNGFAAKQGGEIGEIELEQSIRRNFSGLDDLDPVLIFSQEFPMPNQYSEVKMLGKDMFYAITQWIPLSQILKVSSRRFNILLFKIQYIFYYAKQNIYITNCEIKVKSVINTVQRCNEIRNFKKKTHHSAKRMIVFLEFLHIIHSIFLHIIHSFTP